MDRIGRVNMGHVLSKPDQKVVSFHLCSSRSKPSGHKEREKRAERESHVVLRPWPGSGRTPSLPSQVIYTPDHILSLGGVEIQTSCMAAVHKLPVGGSFLCRNFGDSHYV